MVLSLVGQLSGQWQEMGLTALVGGGCDMATLTGQKVGWSISCFRVACKERCASILAILSNHFSSKVVSTFVNELDLAGADFLLCS